MAGANVVAAQSGYWEQARASTVAAALINEHPDLAALLCSNDNMALGAAAAIRQAGKTGEILIVGFDNIAAVREMVEDGRVLATADQHADQLAVFGIEYALRIVAGDSTLRLTGRRQSTWSRRHRASASRVPQRRRPLEALCEPRTRRRPSGRVDATKACTNRRAGGWRLSGSMTSTLQRP